MFSAPPREAYKTKFLNGPAEIPENEIEYDTAHPLGTGTFGKVYTGRCRGMEVAVKVPKRAAFTAQQLEAFKKEMRIWSRLFHPHVTLFMGAFVSPTKVLLVTEKLEGDLESLLRKNKKLSLFTRMMMAKEAALAIAWLHGQTPKVIHRDIKTSNFLYDKNYRIKVCDFGLSDLAEVNIQDMSGAKGTLLYMCPEVMKGHPFNEKADVYSFGIVLWEILTHSEPFPHHNNVQEFVKAVAHQGERPIIPAGTPPSLVSLMQDCWQPISEARPSFIEICNRMEFVLVDSAIPDPKGNELWRTAFFRQYKVNFDVFSEQFYLYLGLERPHDPTDDNKSGYITSTNFFDSDSQDPQQEPQQQQNLALLDFRLLRTLFASEALSTTEAIVDITNFGSVMACIGPIEQDPMQFLMRVRNLCAQPWFFGSLTTAAAVKTLMGEPKGSFLVRFCNHPLLLGYFVLSKVSRSGKIIHIRIRHSSGSPFSVEGTDTQFRTLEDLIAGADYLHLSDGRPASGSKFQHLFMSAERQSFGYVQFGNEDQEDEEEPYDMDLEEPGW